MRSVLIPNSGYDVSWTRIRGSGLVMSQQALSGALASPHAPRQPDKGLALPESNLPWNNPNDGITIPIPQNLSGNAFLQANPRRTQLTIQNNSTATAAGDVAPTLWMSLNRQAVAGQCISLAPGEGLVWDKDCPRGAIFLLWAGEVDTGFSVTVQGCVIEVSHLMSGQPQPFVSSPGAAGIGGELTRAQLAELAKPGSGYHFYGTLPGQVQ